MAVELLVKNYRCFPDSAPAHFIVDRGFTAFLGVNNAGKSSLLKFFYEFRSLFLHLNQFLSRGGNWTFAPPAVPDITSLFSRTNDRPPSLMMQTAVEYDGRVWQLGLLYEGARGHQNWHAGALLNGASLAPPHPMPSAGSPVIQIQGTYIDYTPLFENCADLAKTLYIGPFRNAINSGGGDPSYFDIAVGEQFIHTWRNFKSGNIVRNNEKAAILVEDIKRIFGLTDLEINPSADDRTLQLLVNRKSFTLNELGGGISQFIIVLANAMMKEPSYILIDEPELGLHPQLQLDFLTTLGAYAQKGVLFCTHSIGLARAVSDKIYAVRRIRDFESEVLDYDRMPRLVEFLGELSFSAYRELGFDKILLVEGTTDVKAIQQFLRALRKDHSVLLLPLGGSALINANCEEQLLELKRVSHNVSALIDSERTAIGAPLGAARQGFINVCQCAGIRCHVLERRALENYFPDRVVKEVLGKSYTSLTLFGSLKQSRRPWPKSENWRMAREMTLSELEGCDFWPFLKSL